jgi:hypothetical protein
MTRGENRRGRRRRRFSGGIERNYEHQRTGRRVAHAMPIVADPPDPQPEPDDEDARARREEQILGHLTEAGFEELPPDYQAAGYDAMSPLEQWDADGNR